MMADFRSGFQYEYDDYSDSSGSMEDELVDPYNHPITSSSTGGSFNVLGAIKRTAKILKRDRINDESPVISIRDINQSYVEDSDNHSYLSGTTDDSESGNLSHHHGSSETSVSGQSFCNEDADSSRNLMSSSSNLVNKTGSKLRTTLRTMTASISSDSTRRRFDLSKQFRRTIKNSISAADDSENSGDEAMSIEFDNKIKRVAVKESSSICDGSFQVETPPSSHPYDENSEYGIDEVNLQQGVDVDIQKSYSDSLGQDRNEYANGSNDGYDQCETESKDDSSIHSDQNVDDENGHGPGLGPGSGPGLPDQLVDNIDVLHDNSMGENVAEFLLSPAQSVDRDQLIDYSCDDQTCSTLDDENLLYENQSREISLQDYNHDYKSARFSMNERILHNNKYKNESDSFGNEEAMNGTDDESEGESALSSCATDDDEQQTDDDNNDVGEDDETFVDDISLFQYGTVSAVENFLDELTSTKGIQKIGGMILSIGNWFSQEDTQKCVVKMDQELISKGHDMDSALSDGDAPIYYQNGQSLSMSPISHGESPSRIKSQQKQGRRSNRKKDRPFDDHCNIENAEESVERSLLHTLFGCTNAKY